MLVSRKNDISDVTLTEEIQRPTYWPCMHKSCNAAARSGLVEPSLLPSKPSETFAVAIHATLVRKWHVQNSVQVGEGGLIL